MSRQDSFDWDCFDAKMQLEVGDMVTWNVLNLSLGDYVTIIQKIKDGQRLEDLNISYETTLHEHTGFVSNIEENRVVVLDFIGKQEVSFTFDDAANKLKKISST